MKRMKVVKRFLAIVGLAFLGFAIIWGIYRYRAYCPKISYSTMYHDTLAVIPIYSRNGVCIATFDSGDHQHMIHMIIDTGNNIDCVELSQEDWNALEANGYIDKEKKWIPPFPNGTAFNLLSGKIMFDETYQIGSLPIIPHKTIVNITPHATFCRYLNYDTKAMNEINNIHFTKTDGESCMGMSLLYNQIVEFSKSDGEMRFYKHIPSDYKMSIDLEINWQNMPFRSYAIPIEVNGQKKSFFIDTGHSKMSIRLPKSEMEYTKNKLSKINMGSMMSVTDTLSTIALKDSKGHVVIGNKEYDKDVYYVDGFVTKYVINPFMFFDEDFLIDFKNWKIWFK